MSANDIYQTPLASRYASQEMKVLFSARKRCSTWRQLWGSYSSSYPSTLLTDYEQFGSPRLRRSMYPTTHEHPIVELILETN